MQQDSRTAQHSQSGEPVVVAKRVDEATADSRRSTAESDRSSAGRPSVDTGEIRALASAAGYAVAAEVTQVRPEDPGTHFGSGTVADIAAAVERTGASTVVVDGQLTPAQTKNLGDLLPEGTRVRDRYRLVLAVFADQSTTRRAQLQVELARLKYALPRMREEADAGWFNKRAEKGSPIYDVEDRIDELERKLDDLQDPAEQHRQQRREQGFDLVTLAGYTNAGKSTLLHRLADEMSLEDEGSEGHDVDGGDAPSEKDATAAIEDRLFKTLETTTRRATVDDRPLLVTDTVGFVDDLPHWLVESFSTTLSEAAAADVVVLVVDAADPVEKMVEKLQVSLDVLDAQGVDPESVVTALNKVDLLSPRERAARERAVADLAPAPVPVSVTGDENVDALLDRVRNRLPTDRAHLTLPNCDDAMRVVSWAYDNASVESVDYDGDSVDLRLSGRPSVVERARAKAETVE